MMTKYGRYDIHFFEPMEETMPKITKRFVEGVTPDPEKTLKFWDSELKGFGIVVLPSGRRTYCIQYRNHKRTLKRFKIGVHGPITTEEARALAKKNLGSVAHGEDPAENKNQIKHLATVHDLARDYIERHGKRKRASSLREDQKLLNSTILPRLGNKAIAHISRREIEALHLSLIDTPYQANRVLALLSKMFSLAESWGWMNGNPVRGMERFQEHNRERWLDKAELKRFWDVLECYPDNMVTYAFKLLLLTGARKSEVLQATWDQFDLEQALWIKPAHLTKQKKREHLPIAGKAVEVLQSLKKLHKKESPYLFPSRLDDKPLKDVRNFWTQVLKEAEIENLRIHDLRHTYASHLVSSGMSLSIVGKLLGHTQVSTTQRYAHLADETLREAAELFGSKVS